MRLPARPALVRVSRPATLALIGPMGAGKTEVGRVLARLLDRKFRDTDAMVQREAGRSIAEIFEQEGEDAFRARESRAVRDASATEGAVIACGGGVVLDPSSVAALRSAGIVVYLKPSLSAAAARVGPGRGRPLLDKDDPRSSLAAIFESRGPLYLSAADHVVDADGSVQEVARAVLAAIGKGASVSLGDPSPHRS